MELGLVRPDRNYRAERIGYALSPICLACRSPVLVDVVGALLVWVTVSMIESQLECDVACDACLALVTKPCGAWGTGLAGMPTYVLAADVRILPVFCVVLAPFDTCLLLPPPRYAGMRAGLHLLLVMVAMEL